MEQIGKQRYLWLSQGFFVFICWFEKMHFKKSILIIAAFWMILK